LIGFCFLAFCRAFGRFVNTPDLFCGRERAMIELQPSESYPGNVGMSRARLVGLIIVCLWFLIGGSAHFVASSTEMRIVPPYIPWPRATVLVSGVFELPGAAGLLYRPTRRAAGVGLFALTIAVTPAHIYMLQRPNLFDVPYWALVLRLPTQAAMLLLIACSTVIPRRSAHAGSGF
jgi:uncharacterized membrane protein